MVQVFCESQKTIILTNDPCERGSIPLSKDIVGNKEAKFCIRRFNMIKVIVGVNVKIALVSTSLLLGAVFIPVQPKIAF